MFPLVEFPFRVSAQENLSHAELNKWNASTTHNQKKSIENGWKSYHEKKVEAFDTIEPNKYYVNNSLRSDTQCPS